VSYNHQKRNPISPWLPKDHSISNKTGIWANLHAYILTEKCIKCLKCWIYCPDSAIDISEDNLTVDDDYCKGCGICLDVCPVKAIEWRPYNE